MKKPLIAATIAVAVAIAGAPAAEASPDGTKCGKRGGASGCQRPGHTSLHTSPDPLPTMPSGSGLMSPAWMPGYGIPVMPTVG